MTVSTGGLHFSEIPKKGGMGERGSSKRINPGSLKC